MVKFEKVYDPKKGKIVKRQEAIDQIELKKVINPFYQCPVCQTKESTLTIEHRNDDIFFKLLPNGKHTDPACTYGIKKSEIREKVKQQRDYLNVKEDSFLYELQKMMLSNGNKTSFSSTKTNAGSSSTNVLTTSSSTVSKTVKKPHPHRFQPTQRNMDKICSILENGEFDKEDKIPIGLYGEIILKFKSQNGKFYNYHVMDKNKNHLFSLGVTDPSLINQIKSHLNKPVKFYGIFNFFLRQWKSVTFLNALVYNGKNHDLIFCD